MHRPAKGVPLLRATALAAIGLILGACDPIRIVSASRTIPAPLDETCVLETLRTDEAVRSAGVHETGEIWAELIIPEGLEIPSHSQRTGFGIEVRRNKKGELEITFEMTWIGRKGSAEYRSYVQKALEDLRDRTIERCGGR